ncbi:BadF/BadG/BcrA/BcrD ATPase family protein [Rhodoferax sp.]|uniref:BadF/BadG/BcrA/BcrD ATPase family protein n=1 Tax=Rhodoferax sp. TaxID=50421 RepID=UPI0027751A53|nr:BadF/BadG/BcrA/BcrD ATPase family protein [Rhodoferax sp.]
MNEIGVMGLGLDAGGSQTRWALADVHGNVLAQGHVAGMSGLQLHTDHGLIALRATLQALAQCVDHQIRGRAFCVYGGFTGLGEARDQARLLALFQEQFPVLASTSTLTHDMDIAFRSAFAPGAGYLVYAGTGSISAFIDARGQLHRAGGRGGVLGDEGGGYWIAREALAWVWRQEDRSPGASQRSPMAQRLFAAMGGDDWACTRQYVYGGDRGTMGRLALQVGASAHEDPVARDLLLRAGAALAELAQHMLHRFGPRPVTAAGRALLLSPLLEQGLRAALPDDIVLRITPDLAAHLTAAHLAIHHNKTGHQPP